MSPGMQTLGKALGAFSDIAITVAASVAFFATFEWGAPSAVQTGKATEYFRGAPWFDVVRYRDAAGDTHYGELRLVVQAVQGEWRDVVTVHHLRRVPSRENCVLTRYKCQRLGWYFEDPSDDWPALKSIPMSNLLRLEHMVCHWGDLVARHGLRAMPSTTPRTAAERRRERFFINAFYSWTSRTLHPM